MTSEQQVRTIERVVIEGELECLSPMHIGNGGESIHELKHPRSDGSKAMQYSELCLGRDRQPYIPGSSLRGLLRRHLAGQISVDLLEGLLGTPHDKVDDTETKTETEVTGHASRLYVADCQLKQVEKSQNQRAAIRIEARTSIDPLTRTAKEHHLFAQAMVGRNSRFVVCLTLEHTDEKEVGLLLAVLAAINGRPEDCLGSGKSLSQGSLRWDTDKQSVKVLSQDCLQKWLSETNKPLSYVEQSKWPMPNLKQAVSRQVNLTLIPQSPLLINDVVKADKLRPIKDQRSNKQDDRSEEPTLHLLCQLDNGKLRVPASSLKGLLRAHCRKIVLTMLCADSVSQNYQAAVEIADELISELFGSQQSSGHISISDALSTEKAKTHEQTFNAIDRFTGGVADGKLYQVRAAWAEALCCQLSLLSSKYPQWMKGVLYLVLRDAMDGQLRLGWGQSRGYGAFTLSIQWPDENEPLNNWESLWQSKQSEISDAVKALSEHVQTLQANIDNNVMEVNV